MRDVCRRRRLGRARPRWNGSSAARLVAILLCLTACAPPPPPVSAFALPPATRQSSSSSSSVGVGVAPTTYGCRPSDFAFMGKTTTGRRSRGSALASSTQRSGDAPQEGSDQTRNNRNEEESPSSRRNTDTTPGGGQRRGASRSSTLTLKELSQRVASNPAKYLEGSPPSTNKNKKKGKRTRQRVLNPQQTYLYRSQRSSLRNGTREGGLGEGDASSSEGRHGAAEDSTPNPVAVARGLGLVASTQHCPPDLSNDGPPQLVGTIEIGDASLEAPPGGACLAYVLHKPAGWSVLGGGGTGSGGGVGGGTRTGKGATGTPPPPASLEAPDESSSILPPAAPSTGRRSRLSHHKKRVKIVELDGTTDVLEYSELDVVALLTPDELDEYLADAGDRSGAVIAADELSRALAKDASARGDGGNVDDEENSDDREASPFVEITTMVDEGEGNEDETQDDTVPMDPVRAANLQRIAARMSSSKSSTEDQPAPTLLVPASRPSLVAWLKGRVGESAPIRGGTYWAAVAGATRVDDSGLVLVAPRHKVSDVTVSAVEYLAVMGTGEQLAKTSSKDSDQSSEVEVEVLSRLRKGRGEDVVHVAKVRSTNPATSCSSIIAAAQEKFQQGVRGDPEANPFDRRASRRLVHCSHMSVSSAVAALSSFESETVPLDIAVHLERGQPTKTLFAAGSFLGRSSLRNATSTNAYREINAAADGCPGWTVDRYDKWLFVQHDPHQGDQGPLPSIHDGNTVGVYLLEQSSPDRSTDGSIRPKLLEGRAAPERFPVLENGITYLVSLQDMSTGIFLDQRPQRAWLARNCRPGTRVLNCFAHSGAYSVAAATAGASTVSIDLSTKWLERLPDHLAANGIPFDERHDAIYGDCFDWLGRLAKRGEKYDVVILDPPSSSVGGRKKRRWSIKNDMDELVALAAGLVTKGGYLWTTTNSASIHPIKFARLCKKGLDDAGMFDAKLERVQPMPGDFPTIGPQAVKNLVWRIP